MTAKYITAASGLQNQLKKQPISYNENVLNSTHSEFVDGDFLNNGEFFN